MQLFTDYIQPLIHWIQFHPHWALLITFFISFCESLAIIGSIVPGTVSMTALGILAGTGIIRIDLTLLAATLGAIGGDFISYLIGYRFSTSLHQVWPFKKYPNLLQYGQDYFDKHGATSVLIGRFAGPLRSIIPIIAGMMHMQRWHFLLANVVSAIGWSILYVLPGVLIGAASADLSPELAGKLFVIILAILLGIWLATLLIKWLFSFVHRILREKLHLQWQEQIYRSRWSWIARYCTPRNETDHYHTAILIVLFLWCSTLFIITTILVVQNTPINGINTSIYLFLQSIRTQPFDAFLMISNQFITLIPLGVLSLSIIGYAVHHRDWKTLTYWLSLIVCASVALIFFTNLINIPKPNGLLHYNRRLDYPAIHITYAASLFSFLIFYINSRYRTNATLIIRILFISLLILGGIATMYLGDNWFTSVIAGYLFGLSIGLLHWILYRRHPIKEERSHLPIIFSCLMLLVTGLASLPVYYQTLKYVHSPYLKQYLLTEHAWWNQKHTMLPIYTTNRIGRHVGLFNIQYQGPLDNMEQTLTHYGWKTQPNSFLHQVIKRASGSDPQDKLPWLAQLYLNRKPTLIMTYDPKNGEPVMILSFWRSNFHLVNQEQTLWLGSIHVNNKIKTKKKIVSGNYDPFKYLIPALYEFKLNKISIPKSNLIELPQPFTPMILLIKAPG